MKNGFTLIELIVVITILSIIAIISVPVVNGVITDSKEKAYLEQEKAIVDAAKTYMASNFSELPKNGEIKCISIEMLKSEGLLKNEDIKNPVGANYKPTEINTYKERDNIFNGCVEVNYNGNKYSYAYKDNGSSGGSSGTVYAYHTNVKTIGTSAVTDGVSNYTQLSSYQSGKVWFLKYELDENNVIQKAYVCMKYDFITDPVCLQGGNLNFYNDNKTILTGLKSIFNTNGIGCNFYNNWGLCNDYPGHVIAAVDSGKVYAYLDTGDAVGDPDEDMSCQIKESGIAYCHN